MSRFAVTGLAAYVVDVAIFNLCLLVLELGPIVSKTVSSVFAISVAFAGSRWFTWRHRPRGNAALEYTSFFLLSVLAVFIQLGCLFVSHHVLGLTGPVADNISGNVVGMGLATAFRFWSFRRFVFVERASSTLRA